jgi:hypothetical protein
MDRSDRSDHPILSCPGVPQRPDKGPAPGDAKWDPIKGRYPAPPPESGSVTWSARKRWIKWSQDGNGCEMGSGTSELVDYSGLFCSFLGYTLPRRGFQPTSEHVRRWTRSGNCPSLLHLHKCTTVQRFLAASDSGRLRSPEDDRAMVHHSWSEASGCELSGIFIQRTAKLDQIGFFKWAGQALLFQKNGPHNFNLTATSAVCLYYVGYF